MKILNLKLLFIFLISVQLLKAQNLVDTTQVYKNTIIEEFSGLGCAGCPNGHSIIEDIVGANPGRIFPVVIYWEYSGYNDPLCQGDPELGRTEPGGYTSMPASIPAGVINREKFGYDSYYFTPDSWETLVDSILNQEAPLFIGFESSYNVGLQELVVDIEVYFKEDFTGEGLLVVTALVEDNIEACQINSDYDTVQNYLHNHVLREMLTDDDQNMDFWYESVVTGNKTPGSIFSTQIIYNDQSLIHQGDFSEYVIENCSLVVYVRSYQEKVVYNGLGLKVGESSSNIGYEEINKISYCKIFPNPSNGLFRLEIGQFQKEPINIEVYSINGILVSKDKFFGQSAILNLQNEPTGVYFIRVQTNDNIYYKKLIKN